MRVQIIGIESPIHHAARLALMDLKKPAATVNSERIDMNAPAKPGRSEPVPKPKQPESATPAKRKMRVLNMAETIRLSDWLRKPASTHGMTTYTAIAIKAEREKVLGYRPSESSIKGLMEALGLKLHQDGVPMDVAYALRLIVQVLTRLVADSECAGAASVQADMKDLRDVVGITEVGR